MGYNVQPSLLAGRRKPHSSLQSCETQQVWVKLLLADTVFILLELVWCALLFCIVVLSSKCLLFFLPVEAISHIDGKRLSGLRSSTGHNIWEHFGACLSLQMCTSDPDAWEHTWEF
jgi:hypothetical protein